MEEQEERSALIDELAILGEQESTGTALFHQTAAAHYGLGISDMKALSILLAEGPQTAGALGAALGLTSGAVTGLVDRLVARGMARRSPDPVDRRRQIIRAEPDEVRGENVYVPIGTAFRRLHARYTTAELAFLVRYLRESVEITRAETAALRQLGPRGQTDAPGDRTNEPAPG